jgi:hypothetical protein
MLFMKTLFRYQKQQLPDEKTARQMEEEMKTGALKKQGGCKEQSKRSEEGYDREREMQECLERRKIWQTENLMAPHGMDRFALRRQRINRTAATEVRGKVLSYPLPR